MFKINFFWFFVFFVFNNNELLAKEKNVEKKKQKYAAMASINAALENVSYLSMRFAVCVKRAKDVLMASDQLNKNSELSDSITFILEPIKEFLIISREQRLAIIPLYKQILQGEFQEKNILESDRFVSRLVLFCNDIDSDPIHYFVKNIKNDADLIELCEEIIIVFGTILNNLTESAQKMYEMDREKIRSIALKKS